MGREGMKEMSPCRWVAARWLRWGQGLAGLKLRLLVHPKTSLCPNNEQLSVFLHSFQVQVFQTIGCFLGITRRGEDSRVLGGKPWR